MPPNERILQLVRQSLESFEEPGFRVSSLVRNAVHIARLRNDFENLWWLKWELATPRSEEEVRQLLMELVPHFSEEQFNELKRRHSLAFVAERKTREPDAAGNLVEKRSACVLPVQELEAFIEQMRESVEKAVIPPAMALAKNELRAKIGAVCSEYNRVLLRIENRTHEFLSITETQLLYGQANADVFERYRDYVDARLRQVAPDALAKFVSAYQRVGEDDPESRSQALASCRRILKSVADQVYPATNKKVAGLDGKERILNDSMYLARLWQFVWEQAKGRATGELLLQMVQECCTRMDRLNELCSKGVHDSVSSSEVDQAVIQTYLVVGDIMRLADGSSALAH